MSIMQPEAQWFIARDGTQHGPLSDAEMKKLVELSYLRPTDLIWRQGFPDWRPALAVFPRPQPGQADALAPLGQPAGLGSLAGPSGLGAPMPNEPRTGRPAAPQPHRDGSASLSATDDTGFDEYDEPYRGGGRGRRLAIIAVLLAVLGAGSYLLYLNRAPLMLLASKFTSSGFSTGSVESPESVDGKLQKTEFWAYAKTEFPDWYQERIAETAKLTEQKKDDTEITKYLVNEIVKFRRQHTDEALAAPTPALKHVAETFRDTLRHLAAENTNSCYQFISHGETSPPIVEIMRKMESSSPVQTQVKSIFAAVVDGRKSPTKRETKAPEDLKALTAELARVGWSQDDIRLFFDPKAFSRAPPERVCQMVQDLFTALLAIPDQGAQERLLIETLRHVMAG